MVAWSCSDNGSVNDKLAADLDEFKVIELSIEAKKVKFSELIASAEIMALEETEESLLGEIYKVSTLKNGNLVFPNRSGADIYIYSNEGRFISKISKKGEGPEEYATSETIWLSGDTLLLYDPVKGDLKKYDVLGNYLEALKLKERPMHLYSGPEGFIGDFWGRLTADSLNFKLGFYDYDMKLVSEALPTDQALPFPIMSSINSFSPYGSKLVYRGLFNDTLFLIDRYKVSPMLKLDFGADYFWNDPEMRSDGRKAMSEIGNRGKVWIFVPKIGQNKVYMTYNTSFQDSEILLIDRKSGEHRILNMKKNQEEDYGFNAIHWEGDKLLASFSSLDVAELSSELEEGVIKYRQGTTLEKIESSENPVLMWIKFKY